MRVAQRSGSFWRKGTLRGVAVCRTGGRRELEAVRLPLEASPRESGDLEDEPGLRCGDLVHGILLRGVMKRF